jgi:hypothetical protein
LQSGVWQWDSYNNGTDIVPFLRRNGPESSTSSPTPPPRPAPG